MSGPTVLVDCSPSARSGMLTQTVGDMLFVSPVLPILAGPKGSGSSYIKNPSLICGPIGRRYKAKKSL